MFELNVNIKVVPNASGDPGETTIESWIEYNGERTTKPIATFTDVLTAYASMADFFIGMIEDAQEMVRVREAKYPSTLN